MATLFFYNYFRICFLLETIARAGFEEAADMPEPGKNIRTKKSDMEGKITKIEGNTVFFQLADGRSMKTSIDNVTVIEKLADEDDEIMEDELNEISNEVLTRYKTAASKDASTADKKGDFKKGDKRFSGIVKATNKQFDNDAKKTVEEGYAPLGSRVRTPQEIAKIKKSLAREKARGDTGVYRKEVPSQKAANVKRNIEFAKTADNQPNYDRFSEGEDSNSNNPADTVTVDVPLLIRIMEYAKEDAKSDLDLHNAAEKLIELSREGRTLTMDDYDTMIGDVNEGGMGGINRSAPSNDVSYQDVLDDSTDEWRGDTVKVEDVAQPLTREALRSRQKELQRIQMDPETSRSPLMKKELAKKIAQLRQQAEASNLVDTYESKLSKFLEDEELS